MDGLFARIMVVVTVVGFGIGAYTAMDSNSISFNSIDFGPLQPIVDDMKEAFRYMSHEGYDQVKHFIEEILKEIEKKR